MSGPHLSSALAVAKAVQAGETSATEVVEAALARIHAPIGLDIGAVSPAEIAVSIIAEIIAAQRKKPLRVEGRTL